jgi:hypothetical protein
MSIKLKGSSDGSVSLDAPADTSPSGTDVSLTLPTSAGSANQFIKNGSAAGELEHSSMVEDSNGRVGIGTNSPDSLLHLSDDSGGATGRIKFGCNVSSGYDTQIDTTDVGLEFTAKSNSRGFAFSTGSTPSEKVRITAGGFVGIGTATPGTLLDVAGGARSIGSLACEHNTSSAQVIVTGRGVSSDMYLRGTDSSGSITWGLESDNGDLILDGSISKGSGSFRIDHPLKPETHNLVHSFVEAPDASNLYAGMVDLVDGTATVNIDTAHRMTEGTFEALNTVQSWSSSNETGYSPVKCSISGNLLTIQCQDVTSTDTVYYEVRGIRKDQHMLDTEWTDENGRVITEPLKVAEETEDPS